MPLFSNEMLKHWVAAFFISLLIGYVLLQLAYTYLPIGFYIIAFIMLFILGLPWGWRFKKVRPSVIVGIEVAIAIVFIQRIFFMS